MSISIEPSLATVRDVLSASSGLANPPNLVPLSATLSAEFLTPSSIYLKLAAQYVHLCAFGYEIGEKVSMLTVTIGSDQGEIEAELSV